MMVKRSSTTTASRVDPARHEVELVQSLSPPATAALQSTRYAQLSPNTKAKLLQHNVHGVAEWKTLDTETKRKVLSDVIGVRDKSLLQCIGVEAFHAQRGGPPLFNLFQHLSPHTRSVLQTHGSVATIAQWQALRPEVRAVLVHDHVTNARDREWLVASPDKIRAMVEMHDAAEKRVAAAQKACQKTWAEAQRSAIHKALQLEHMRSAQERNAAAKQKNEEIMQVKAERKTTAVSNAVEKAMAQRREAVARRSADAKMAAERAAQSRLVAAQKQQAQHAAKTERKEAARKRAAEEKASIQAAAAVKAAEMLKELHGPSLALTAELLSASSSGPLGGPN